MYLLGVLIKYWHYNNTAIVWNIEDIEIRYSNGHTSIHFLRNQDGIHSLQCRRMSVMVFQIIGNTTLQHLGQANVNGISNLNINDSFRGASDTESVSISWCHHRVCRTITTVTLMIINQKRPWEKNMNIFTKFIHFYLSIWLLQSSRFNVPLCYYGLTLIPARICNNMHSKMWDEITYPSPNINGCTVEVWE